MPIFEYRCKKCGTKFEELIQGDRNRVVPCPHCGHESTEKLISVIGGIATGKSTGPICGSGGCPGAGASGCMSGAGGCCPHAG